MAFLIEKITEKYFNYRNPGSLSFKFKKQRADLLYNKLLVNYDYPNILDIGGTYTFWTILFGDEVLKKLNITCLNLELPDDLSVHANIKCIVGDARKMDNIPDKSYDIVTSHSLIEHVGKNVGIVAQNIRRIGKSYFVQTPSFGFPIEAHFHLPLAQFIPKSITTRIIKKYGKLGTISDIQDAQNLNLLTKRKMRQLFPDSILYVERFLGLEKSLIAYHLGD